MDVHGTEKRWSGERMERMDDLHVDRLEALCNLAYLMRSDIGSRERLEMYLQMMDKVIAGMTADARARYAQSPEINRAG